jgi:hypothetical protein
MNMKQTLNKYQFRDAFHAMGRQNQFSYDGLGILFDYLEEMAPDTELDVIGLCCEYAESMPATIVADYSIDVDGLDDDAVSKAVTDYVNDYTMLCGVTESGALVYAQF